VGGDAGAFSSAESPCMACDLKPRAFCDAAEGPGGICVCVGGDARQSGIMATCMGGAARVEQSIITTLAWVIESSLSWCLDAQSTLVSGYGSILSMIA
jgi:hypothetical protein